MIAIEILYNKHKITGHQMTLFTLAFSWVICVLWLEIWHFKECLSSSYPSVKSSSLLWEFYSPEPAEAWSRMLCGVHSGRMRNLEKAVLSLFQLLLGSLAFLCDSFPHVLCKLLLYSPLLWGKILVSSWDKCFWWVPLFIPYNYYLPCH